MNGLLGDWPCDARDALLVGLVGISLSLGLGLAMVAFLPDSVPGSDTLMALGMLGLAAIIALHTAWNIRSMLSRARR